MTICVTGISPESYAFAMSAASSPTLTPRSAARISRSSGEIKGRRLSVRSPPEDPRGSLPRPPRSNGIWPRPEASDFECLGHVGALFAASVLSDAAALT